MRQAGKGVILEMANETLKARIEKIIRSEQLSRTSVKLSSAVLFTQVIICIYMCIYMSIYMYMKGRL
jgi:hypothetical protein